MTNASRKRADKESPITASDLGRYLKRLSALNRDSRTGNPALSSALQELASILIGAKSLPVDEAMMKFLSQKKFDFIEEETHEYSELDLAKVEQLLAHPNISKTSLITIGSKRFGIAISRIEKLPRAQLVQTIRAALEHEESLAIISDEAMRGGQGRKS